MKQLLILSGKGGTGKTTIASAFIKLADASAYADCDVDAPNLHLISGWSSEPKKTDYYGLPKAEINPELCIRCDSADKTAGLTRSKQSRTIRLISLRVKAAVFVHMFAPWKR